MSTQEALAILLAALIATSAVELLKELTPLRYAFNRWAVQRWLWRGLDLQIHSLAQMSAILSGDWLDDDNISHPTAKDAKRFAWLEQRLVELAACGQRAALYRPEIAQIAGQLNLLAERLMDFPAQDPVVLRAIAGVSVERAAGSRNEPDEDLKRLEGLKQGFRAALATAESDTEKPATAGGASLSSGELMDTRTRVTAWVQGRLNELQTTGRTSWRTMLLALAIAIGIAVVWLSGRGTLLDGVFAGILAPIGYELLSMVKRIGRV